MVVSDYDLNHNLSGGYIRKVLVSFCGNVFAEVNHEGEKNLVEIYNNLYEESQFYSLSKGENKFDFNFKEKIKNLYDLNLISQYNNYINNKNYKQILNITAGEYQKALYEIIVNPINKINKVGLFNIKDISNVKVIEEIPYVEYYELYQQVEKFGEDIKLFLVQSTMVAYENNEFYNDGNRYDVMFVGNVNGKRKILYVITALQGTIKKYSDNEMNLMSNISSGVCIPKYILVKKVNGQIESVDFKTYCKKVAAREVGYDSYNQERHKACCIAVKNYAMYKILTAPVTLGYHICATTEAQVYDESVNYNSWPNVMAAMDNTWGLYLSDQFGNCVNTEYRSGNDSSHQVFNKPSSGVMLQNVAQEMANNNKNYKQILEYFYSNSYATNYTALRYLNLREHQYVYNDTYGYYQCRTCGHIIPTLVLE